MNEINEKQSESGVIAGIWGFGLFFGWRAYVFAKFGHYVLLSIVVLLLLVLYIGLQNERWTQRVINLAAAGMIAVILLDPRGWMVEIIGWSFYGLFAPIPG